MLIAIDVREAYGEKSGKGFYTYHLVKNLLEIDKKNKYILYSKEKISDFDEFKNAKQLTFNGTGPLWHFRVIRHILKNPPDIFFAPSSFIIPSFLPKKIKTLLTVHDLIALIAPSGHSFKAALIEKLLLKRAVKRATHILPVSDHTKKDLMRLCKMPISKSTVICCAADSIFQPLESSKLESFIKEANIPSKFFLAVGTLIPRKNYLRLIRAFFRVQKIYPDQHLLIVGGKGWDCDRLFAEVKILNLQDNIHFLSYIKANNLVKLYNLAQALVFPSLYEGFGIPPLEAMQSGCPVICSQTSSIPEVVGESAIFINPHDVESIKTALIRALKKPEDLKFLREDGLRRAKLFSWEVSARKLLDIIEKNEIIESLATHCDRKEQ